MRIFDLHSHPILMGSGTQPKEIKQLHTQCTALGIVGMNSLGDVSFYGHIPDAKQVADINNGQERLQQLFPDFFTSFCLLNPTLGEKAVMKETERCLAKFNSKGIKLEKSNNASASCMKHVAKAAREFDLPILQHTWTVHGIAGRRVSRRIQSDPVDTANFARKNPDVQIIMAHMTGFGFRGIAEVKHLPNVSVDTSAGYPEEGMIEYAVEQLGADRVYYGSDLPIREQSVTIGRILGARITQKDRQKILYDNAARLLRLN
jgi:predicted TIM-barrel fold metal-dependent hydrolase